LIPLIGHAPLRKKLAESVARNALPSSLLLHGPEGAGKERLALWLANLLLCDSPGNGEPCGECQHCRYVSRGAHPDLHWYFPRPRLKNADPDMDDVLEDLAEGIAERLESKGPWPPAAPTDSLYVATIRALVRRATLTPAMARRKIIVVADAERMVPQEGSEQAANAFLKLLEEPLADTTLILTSSAPGSLLPTVRSRAVAMRVPPLTADAARELGAFGAVRGTEGAAARAAATALLNAATGDDAARFFAAFSQGGFGARGAYTETLEALTQLLHDRTRAAVANGREHDALGAARAIECVEQAKRLANQNVNPQLISARLLADIAPLVA
jgi:DNA polymerase-3 subunit delta'